MGTRISIDKGQQGFEPLIAVFAESLSSNPWWRYHTLIAGTDSEGLGVSDPDNFCVYNAITRKIVWMTAAARRGGHIFRLHDGTKARLSKVSDTHCDVLAFGGSAGAVHQCVGRVHLGCSDETDLRIDSAGLSYPWELPRHIQYESKKDIQWVTP